MESKEFIDDIESPTPEIQQPRTRTMNRRSFIQLLAVSIGNAALGVACRKENPKKHTKTQPNPTKELSINKKVLPPSIEATTKEFLHPIPESINVEYEKYLKASKRAMGFVVNHGIPALKESLRKHPSKVEYPKTLQRFVNYIVQVLKTDPTFSNFLAKGPDDPKENFIAWAQYLKPICYAGGYFFDLQILRKTAPETNQEYSSLELRLYEIKDQNVGTMKDKEDELDVPFFDLEEPLHVTGKYSHVGEYDGTYNSVLMYSKNRGAKVKKRLEMLENAKLIGKGELTLKQAEEIDKQNTIVHEGTHAFIGTRFPIAKDTSDHTPIPFDYTLELDKEMQSTVKGDYRIIHFMELAAVGNEIYQSELKGYPPLTLFDFAEKQGRGYKLVDDLFLSLIMHFMPNESDKKAILLSRLSKGEILLPTEIREIIFKDLSSEQRKQIGLKMYQLAYSFFQQIRRRPNFPQTQP